MSQTQIIEETDVQIVILPVPQVDRQAVAAALLAAAGEDRIELIGTVSEGFRVPYGIARDAGALGYLANEPVELVTPVVTEPVSIPTDPAPVTAPVAPVEPPAPPAPEDQVAVEVTGAIVGEQIDEANAAAEETVVADVVVEETVEDAPAKRRARS